MVDLHSTGGANASDEVNQCARVWVVEVAGLHNAPVGASSDHLGEIALKHVIAEVAGVPHARYRPGVIPPTRRELGAGVAVVAGPDLWN